MTEMMTRFLGLGFTLEQVITMCTVNPAKAIGAADRLGSLAAGRQADVSVLRVQEGNWVVYDVLGASMSVTKAVLPVLTIKRGETFTPEMGSAAVGMGA
jgi:dihydroorotase